MNEQLTMVPVDTRPQPDNHHDRTGHILEPKNSKVFFQLLKTEEFAVQNKMRINYRKTKMIVFNPSKAKDFQPKFELSNNLVEVVEESKLLGVVISSDLSWSANTSYMISRANKKLWFLRRLKALGAEDEDLKEVYIKQIRSILEYAVPVWHSSLTVGDSMAIERIQKSALRIILSQRYHSYSEALGYLDIEPLYLRRNSLCIKFARKCLSSNKFSKWFKPDKKITITRQQNKKFCRVFSRTVRYDKGPLSYLTNLLNNLK